MGTHWEKAAYRVKSHCNKPPQSQDVVWNYHSPSLLHQPMQAHFPSPPTLTNFLWAVSWTFPVLGAAARMSEDTAADHQLQWRQSPSVDDQPLTHLQSLHLEGKVWGRRYRIGVTGWSGYNYFRPSWRLRGSSVLPITAIRAVTIEATPVWLLPPLFWGLLSPSFIAGP